MSIIRKILIAIIGLLFVTSLSFYAYNKYLSYSLKESKDSNEKLERTIVLKDTDHKRIVFENNASISIKKSKEIKDAEIPSDIGIHTISFDDD